METNAAKRITWQDVEVGKLVFPVHQAGDYQRSLKVPKVARIVKRFDILRFGTPEVAFYNDHFWVWDGMHRVMVAKELGIPVITCRVVYGYSIEELSIAFARQGQDRTSVSPKDTTRAMLVGRDPSYVEALSILVHHGYDLALSRTSGGGSSSPNVWRCHGALAEVIRPENGLSDLDLICRLLRSTWGDCEPTGSFLDGLGIFVKTYRRTAPLPAGSRDYFDKTLAAILTTHSQEALLRRARDLQVTRGGTVADSLRWALVSSYNLGRRAYRLPVETA